VQPDLPAWLTLDLRVEAAFRLALRGARDGLDRLERWARGDHDGDIASALVHLGWLAWPDGVSATAGTLGGEDPHALGWAIDAASALRAAALVAPLLALAARSELPASPDGLALDEQALAVAGAIAGCPPTVPECRRAVAALDPTHRYWRGRPLTLAQLAADLESPHAGPLRVAAYNLRSLTGEHHGFDPAFDFIANLPAIDRWQERAAAFPLAPGGWAWQGQPLRPPPLPAEGPA
jgi:hypothetical protein